MKNMLRRWLLSILPASVIDLIRREILPSYRKGVNVLNRMKKFSLEKKISANSDSALAQMNLGHIFFKLGQYKEAIQCYEKAIEIDSNLLDAHLKLEMLIRFDGHEKLEDSKGNRIFDNRTYALDHKSFDKLLKCTQKMVELFPESIEANFRRGNALIMVLGNREQASYHFYQSTKLRIAKSRKNGNFGPIFVASMHRSASGFIQSSLRNGLGMSSGVGHVVSSTSWWYPDITIPMPTYALTMDSIPDGISVDHTSGMLSNLVILNLCVDRIMVNVRDPRQGLISYVHYIRNYMRTINNIEGLLETHIPKEYFCLSLTDQISWQIDNFYLPASIQWIQSWYDAEKNPNFYPSILFTTQEGLVANQSEYFKRILKFYEFDESKFIFPEKPEFKKNTRMRSGGVDEWKDVFTQEQVERATRMIPEEMLTRFGWTNISNSNLQKDALVNEH